MLDGKDILSKKELAKKWGTSERTIDRLREDGVLPWIDLGGNRTTRPIVKFRLADILEYEKRFTRAINEKCKF